jgi:adenosylcobyric acid synthase
LVRPLLDLDGRPDGAMSPDGRVAGCYVHGLFAADGFRAAFLAGLKPRAADGLAYDATVDATLDGLANHLERHLDLPALAAIAGLPG